MHVWCVVNHSMSSGVAVNGAVTISVMTTLLVGIVYFSDTRYQLFKLLSRVPATKEFKARRQLLALASQLHEVVLDPGRQAELQEALKRIEMLGLDIAVASNDGNVSATARNIGVSRATLVRKRTYLPTNEQQV